MYTFARKNIKINIYSSHLQFQLKVLRNYRIVRIFAMSFCRRFDFVLYKYNIAIILVK